MSLSASKSIKSSINAVFNSVRVDEDGRERWSSRVAFYFAAVGSAVGFGNVWRFPVLVYEYGGGAFFIPYVLALFFIGIPILVLEIALGQLYQTGDVGCFGSINRRLRGVGLSSVACGYMLVSYYSMLLAWVCNAFFSSFGSSNFWAQDQVTGTEAKGYFYDNIIGMSTLNYETLRATRLVPENVGYSFLTWCIIYLCIAFGLKVTGRITYFTMGAPVILLFIFLGRAVSLEGASDGIDEYIRDSNWDALTKTPQVWALATSQIFFSLSVTFGIMTAYGSHCKSDEPAFANGCVVAISNCLFSFISGFAVFATLGYLCNLEDTCESVADLEYSSFGLVFGSWPVALGTLPGGEHWIRLFFVMLFLLGIDSAFSFMEGFLTVVQDTRLYHNANKKIANRKVVTAVVALFAFLLSLMYATDAGLLWLDTIDYYINFVMLLVGGFECFAAGWIYNIEGQIERLGANIVFTYITTTFGSVILACVLWFAVPDASQALWAGFVGLVGFYAIGMTYVHCLMRKKKQGDESLTFKGMYYDLTMKNVMDLTNDLRAVVGFMPSVWAFLIKHFIPPIICILFSLNCDATTVVDGNAVKKFGHYEGYPFKPYQILGILLVVFAGFLFVSSLVFPRMYDGLEKPPEKSVTDQSDKKVDDANADLEEVSEKEENIEASKVDAELEVPKQAVQPDVDPMSEEVVA